MTEVLVKTPNGDQIVNTVPKKPERPVDANALRRVSMIDLDGVLGQFLSWALPQIAPGAYSPNNWKNKLANFIASKTVSFIVCGRAVALAHVVTNPMSGENEAHGLFMLVAEGGLEEDAVNLLRVQKQWARDMGIGYRPPLKEYSSLSQSKIQQALKSDKREELWIPALAKK